MLSSFSTRPAHHQVPSKLIIRSTSLAAVVIVSLCSILYLKRSFSTYTVKTKLERLLPGVSVNTEIKLHWNDSPRRLIVFGDSWSDNGQYPVNPPTRELTPTRDDAQGKIWTDWLCSSISCTHHDNFARSLPHVWDSGYSGAVVDSNLLNSTLSNTTLSNSTFITDIEWAEPLADLKAQVQHWLAFEKKQYANSRVSEVERSGTVFIVWFSLWDLWYYSEKTLAEAEAAVAKTMDALFEQLDVIAENWPSEMKLIIPEAIDTTFLPGWHTMRTGPRGSDPLGEKQRSAVLLVEQWNRGLDMRAVRWRGGSMYIYNTNEWLLDQVREQQLSTAHLSDANGMGANQSPWNNVRSGCVASNYKAYDVLGEDPTAGRCSDPTTYLFWDDMHLGPEAMKMIGQGIAQDIAANRATSWFAHAVEESYEDEDEEAPLPQDPHPEDSPT
ncbi:hypothetical protein HO133_004683 [Letharia lupina]|uniref:Uncharacterized protein n=1 Tax=Letharia lupina TaxID=560253 RepID=A0A8H6FKU3_9LECA|nr:uncharacterized protein HO133_004683 [Letharia lupina]KAF6230343.1 hypothetical protein HO133_004683 [Letharia lupina]